MPRRDLRPPGLSEGERRAALESVACRVRAVPDFPKPGILFRDITPVLADPRALSLALDLHLDAIDDLVSHTDKVVGIESRGFLFGMALATRLGVGFVPVRKPGKLPAQTLEERYSLEYGTDALQIHGDSLAAGERVLLVDDLLATGGTAAAAERLINRLGAEVVACLFFIELDGLGGRGRIASRRVESLLRF
ncbi:MAG: adenine phosphoribosyltransferase [Nannocystaceae bacterium]